ncbi:succinate dehydrogenase assembly factor 4, mitochondrial [Lissotriton helveticus]
MTWGAGRLLCYAAGSWTLRLSPSLKYTLGAQAAPALKLSQECGWWYNSSQVASYSSEEKRKKPLKKPKTPQGRLDNEEPVAEKDPLQGFPDGVNPVTKERGGPKGPEPTRYGDWERKGRCIDF